MINVCPYYHIGGLRQALVLFSAIPMRYYIGGLMQALFAAKTLQMGLQLPS